MLRTASALLLVIATALAQDGPLLLVHKTLDLDVGVVGRNLTVTTTVYNIGKAAAFDVTLSDTWPLGEPGAKSAQWAAIDARGNVSHSFVITPEEPGVLETQPARVTYGAEGSKEPRTVTSNDIVDITWKSKKHGDRMYAPRNHLVVMTSEEYDRQSSRKIKEWFTFLLLLIIPVVMPGYFWQVSANNLKGKRGALQASAKDDPASKAGKAQKDGKRGSRRSGSRGRQSGGKK